MSYSRWSNSRWYTYWCLPKSNVPENRDTALFAVDSLTFTASRLRADIETCLRKACSKDVTDEEREELRGYMNEFLTAVDSASSTAVARKSIMSAARCFNFRPDVHCPPYREPEAEKLFLRRREMTLEESLWVFFGCLIGILIGVVLWSEKEARK